MGTHLIWGKESECSNMKLMVQKFIIGSLAHFFLTKFCNNFVQFAAFCFVFQLSTDEGGGGGVGKQKT